MADIKYIVTVDASGATKSIQTFEQAVADLGKASKSVSTESQSFGHQLTSKLIPAFTAATLAADAIKKGLRFLGEQFKETISAAIEAERVDRALESSLNIVGQAAGGTAERIKAYASALQRKTIYDDEAIKSAQALIIQMRGTASQIDVATKGAIGLASVFGMDLQSAAKAVGQGFEGNYRQLGMLIPAVRQATTDGEKHSAMMNALAGYYQRAESDAQTFGGRLDDLKKTYGELQESIGTFVTKNKDVISTLAGIKEIIIWLDRNVQKIEGKQGSKGMKWFDFTGPGMLLKSIQSIGGAAKKANEEFEDSFYGMTLSMLEFRKTALDPIPVKMLDTTIATKKAEAAFRAAGLALAELHRRPKDIKTIPFMLFGDFPPDKMAYELPKLQKSVSDIVKYMSDPKNAPKPTAWRKSFQQWAEDASKTMDEIVSKTSQAFSMMDSIVAQSQRNREIAIENEYKKRLDAINKSTLDEEAKQRAIIALEAEFEIKRTSAKRAAAKQAKAIAMMEAIVNTADAYTKALAQGGFLLGIPWASIVAALGAIQIAMIAKQPIPLAKGYEGVVRRPTVFMAGEAGPEYLSVRPAGRGGGGGVVVHLNGPLVSVRELSDSNIRAAGDKLYAEVQRQARRIGRLAWQT